jgi:hypothetical protein
MRVYKVDDEILTQQGYWVRVVEAINWNHYVIRFDNGFEMSVTNKVLMNGNVQYPFHPTVFGVGYLGVGKYSSTSKVKTRSTNVGLSKAYSIWQGMLGRCYCPIIQGRQKTYVGSTVHPYWHNYQNFARWFDKNYIEGFAISKNILQKNCTVYSEDTCCFVPMELANAFIKRKLIKSDLPAGVDYSNGKFSSSITTMKYTNKGAVNSTEYFGVFSCVEDAFLPYKQAKEKQLRYYASFWKDLLSPEVQKALRNYKVEMDD